MNKTVLVIDDDEILNKTLARGLRAEGFDIISAFSAEEGANILSRIQVDAIILDRMMTGIDGLTFLQSLRAVADTTPLRELVLRLNNILKTSVPALKTPKGLVFTDNEFFIDTPEGQKLFALSSEEKKLLMHLTAPMGNIVSASPMVAKRLRAKLNGVLSNLDIITIRGQGYKIIDTPNAPNK